MLLAVPQRQPLVGGVLSNSVTDSEMVAILAQRVDMALIPQIAKHSSQLQWPTFVFLLPTYTCTSSKTNVLHPSHEDETGVAALAAKQAQAQRSSS